MLLLVAILALPSPALAEDDPWAKQWKDCAAYNMPQYLAGRLTLQELLKQGSAWEKDVKTELDGIERITGETCKKWALDPNGDGALREFTAAYGAASESALSISDRGQNVLTKNLNLRFLAENAELASAHLTFESFPCGRAFQSTQKHIQEKLQAVRTGFQSIRDKCPGAAAGIIAKASADRATAAAQANGKSAPSTARAPASAPASDITGTNRKDAKLP